MLIRSGMVGTAALALLAVVAAGAHAQYRDEARRGAAAAARQAREAEELARERAAAAREEKLRQELVEMGEVEEDLRSDAEADAFDDFEDPLDEIDDFGDVDEVGGPELDADPTRAGTANPLDPVQAFETFDDDERDSLARDAYRAAERELDADAPRPYDLRDDTPGLDAADPFGAGGDAAY